MTIALKLHSNINIVFFLNKREEKNGSLHQIIHVLKLGFLLYKGADVEVAYTPLIMIC